MAYAPYLFPNNLFMSGWVPQILGNALTVWLLVALLGLWQAVAPPLRRAPPAPPGPAPGPPAGGGRWPCSRPPCS